MECHHRSDMFPRASSLGNSTDSTESAGNNVVDRSGLRHWTLVLHRASHGLRNGSDLPELSRATNSSGSCRLVEPLRRYRQVRETGYIWNFGFQDTCGYYYIREILHSTEKSWEIGNPLVPMTPVGRLGSVRSRLIGERKSSGSVYKGYSTQSCCANALRRLH